MSTRHRLAWIIADVVAFIGGGWLFWWLSVGKCVFYGCPCMGK